MTLEELNSTLKELFFEQNPKFKPLEYLTYGCTPIFDKYGKLHLIDFRITEYYNKNEDNLWKPKQ